MMGTLSGGFERFFQHMGTETDHPTKDQPPFIPDFPRMQAAAQQHNMQFMPDYTWPRPPIEPAWTTRDTASGMVMK